MTSSGGAIPGFLMLSFPELSQVLEIQIQRGGVCGPPLCLVT